MIVRAAGGMLSNMPDFVSHRRYNLTKHEKDSLVVGPTRPKSFMMVGSQNDKPCVLELRNNSHKAYASACQLQSPQCFNV